MKKILCDKCGMVIRGNSIKLIPVIDAQPDKAAGKAPHENEQVERDYCPECLEKIIAFANENATLNEGKKKKGEKKGRAGGG